MAIVVQALNQNIEMVLSYNLHSDHGFLCIFYSDTPRFQQTPSQHTSGARPGIPKPPHERNSFINQPRMEVLNIPRQFSGMVFSLHKPYIQLLQVSTSILACGRRATMAGDFFASALSPWLLPRNCHTFLRPHRRKKKAVKLSFK